MITNDQTVDHTTQTEPAFSLGWTRTDRAPALRRHAHTVEVHAARAGYPAPGRQLARAMRVRASELELGHRLNTDLDELIDAIAFPPRRR